ncbi:MAG: ribosomal protein large subunit ribosomal protein [Candidatus Parcubacteria bacterium]|jgi:large subunit ribosomal protein L18
MKQTITSSSRDRRRKRIRSTVSGTAERPRLSVYKSNTATYAQLIDDERGVTLVAASSMNVKGNKTEAAKKVGIEVAKKAVEQKIAKVVFDRGGFIYTGRIKALAEGAREGGLNF